MKSADFTGTNSNAEEHDILFLSTDPIPNNSIGISDMNERAGEEDKVFNGEYPARAKKKVVKKKSRKKSRVGKKQAQFKNPIYAKGSSKRKLVSLSSPISRNVFGQKKGPASSRKLVRHKAPVGKNKANKGKVVEHSDGSVGLSDFLPKSSTNLGSQASSRGHWFSIYSGNTKAKSQATSNAAIETSSIPSLLMKHQRSIPGEYGSAESDLPPANNTPQQGIKSPIFLPNDSFLRHAEEEMYKRVKNRDRCMFFAKIVLFFLPLITLIILVGSLDDDCSETGDVLLDVDKCSLVEEEEVELIKGLSEILVEVAGTNTIIFSFSEANQAVEPIACLPESAIQKAIEINEVPFEVDTIRIDSIGLRRITSSAFRGELLEEVSTLKITGNPLTSLPDGVFSLLNNLEELDLSSNALLTVNNDIFGDLTSLDIVSFSSNSGLVEFPLALNILEDIGSLDLSNCPSMLIFNEEDFVDTSFGNVNLTDNLLLEFQTLNVIQDALGI